VRTGKNKKAYINDLYRLSTHMKKHGCRGRVRTSTEQLAKKQSLVVNPGRLNPDLHRDYVGSTFRLSCDLHPRDERACLPKISSPHSICIKNFLMQY